MIQAYCLNCQEKFVQSEAHHIFCPPCFDSLVYQGKTEDNRERRTTKRRKVDQ